MELFRKDVVTVAEMKELERLGDAAGLPYYDMMENAGTYSNVIRFLAPLCITDAQMEKGLDILEASIKEAMQ